MKWKVDVFAIRLADGSFAMMEPYSHVTHKPILRNKLPKVFTCKADAMATMPDVAKEIVPVRLTIEVKP